MKFYISEETGSIIWYENGQPRYAPILTGNFVDLSEAADPDLELVGEELVGSSNLTINELYQSVKDKTDNPT